MPSEKGNASFGQLKEALHRAMGNREDLNFESGDISDYAMVTRDVLDPLQRFDFATAADNAFDCANTGIVDGLSKEDRAEVLRTIDSYIPQAKTAADAMALQRARAYFTPRN